MSDKTSDKRLLPCPFCGGELELEEKGKFYIHPSGKCFMNLNAVKNSEIRIKAWNTRKPVDAVLEHLEEEKQNALKLWDNNSRYMGYEHSIEIIKEKLIWERESIEDK